MRGGEIYGFLALGFLLAGLAYNDAAGHLVAFLATGVFGGRALILSYGERR